VKTNITYEHLAAFLALRSPLFTNFALFSCFVNGEPTAAIVTVNKVGSEEYVISPLFVAVTPGMTLADHDGKEPLEAL
jgi:hypothetical protein